MNLFLEYQKKIFNILKKIEKKKIIDLPNNFKSLTVELPPKGYKADISCNVAMLIAKLNKKTPLDLANILKKHLLLKHKVFKGIEIAGPGFLNISFQNYFWREYLKNQV